MSYTFDYIIIPDKWGYLAFAQIYLKTFTRELYTKDAPLITPRCVSETEVDEEVERLKSELESIGKRIKDEFKEYKESLKRKS